MTDIRKSDAQLDAEAQPLEERDLDAAIELHRQLFRADVWIPRLHSRTGSGSTTATGKDVSENAEVVGSPEMVSVGGIGWTGMAFSPLFENYLNGDYGSAFPWSKALFALRYVVCRHHPEHQSRKEWQPGLCYRLVDLVIRREWSLDMARLELGLPHEGKTRRTLDSALLVIERRMEDDYRRQQETPQRTVAEWMAPAHEHVGLPGLHAEECEQCRRAA